MTNEIDVLKKAILEHEKALKLKDLNVELNSHLTSSIYWLLKYSEKYNMPLPMKDGLLSMLDKSDVLIDSIISKSKEEKYQPIVNTNNNSREDNRAIL